MKEALRTDDNIMAWPAWNVAPLEQPVREQFDGLLWLRKVLRRAELCVLSYLELGA